MGTDPKSSVVDADGRLHDVDNVYVIDAGVHVTNGGFNPALTILANAYRASERLLQSLEGLEGALVKTDCSHRRLIGGGAGPHGARGQPVLRIRRRQAMHRLP